MPRQTSTEVDSREFVMYHVVRTADHEYFNGVVQNLQDIFDVAWTRRGYDLRLLLLRPIELNSYFTVDRASRGSEPARRIPDHIFWSKRFAD